MMVASLDISGRSIVFLSIPRDLYVETPYVRGRINEIVRDESAVHLRISVNSQSMQRYA